MHDIINDLLHQYIDDELGQVEAILLLEHLKNCQPCRKKLNHLKLVEWDLKHQPEVIPPPELKEVRSAAIKIHLADAKTTGFGSSLDGSYNLTKMIIRHTFGFISYNPVNRKIARSMGKSYITIKKTATNGLKSSKLGLFKILPNQI